MLLTIAVPVLLSLPHLTFQQMLDNLTMMQQPLGTPPADGSYWTLWRELLFYLLFATVVWRGVNYQRVLSFCVLWMLGSVLASAYPNGFVAKFVDVEYSMYFVGGIAMYLMYRFRPTLLLWGVIGWSWILAEHQLGRVEGALELGGISRRWWIASAIVTLSYLVLIAAALGWLDWARWRILTFIGALTYPLYLIHQSLGLTIVSRLSGNVNKFALLTGLIAGMLLLAWLINRFVERPAAPILRRRLRLAIADSAAHSDTPTLSGRHVATTARPSLVTRRHGES